MVYARSNLDVFIINSASIYFGESRNSFTNYSEKFMIHLSGVTISCVTLDYNSYKSLLSASIIANFFVLVTSLKVAT